MKRHFLFIAIAFSLIATTNAQQFTYQKVMTPLADWSGEYLIVREVDSIGMAWVFDGSLVKLDAKNNCFQVPINKESNRIASTAQTNAATFTIAKREDGTYSILSHSGYYMGYNALDELNLNNLKQDVVDKYQNTIRFESDTTTKVLIQAKCGYVLRFNQDPLSNRFRFYAEGKKKGIHLYKKVDTTDLNSTPSNHSQPINGALYFLPQGMYIINGKIIYLPIR